MKKLLVSLIVGIFVISTISIFAQGYEFSDREGNRFRDRDRIHDQLNLTDDQDVKIKQLRINHQTEIIDYKAELEKKELELQELRIKGNYIRSDYLSITNELMDIKNKMHLARANHQMDVYELLDNSQKETWNNLKNGFPRHKGNFRQFRNKPRFN